jgi:hypothetical protein
VGLEDRDWYRDEASRAYWREVDDARAAPSGANGRVAGGLLAAACLSAALALAGTKGYLPALKLPSVGPSPPIAESDRGEADRHPTAPIRLGSSPGFDRRGPAGRRWCIATSPAGRVCAVTGTAESGRDALTRVLRSKGVAVTPK